MELPEISRMIASQPHLRYEAIKRGIANDRPMNGMMNWMSPGTVEHGDAKAEAVVESLLAPIGDRMPWQPVREASEIIG